ncbi:hypothetical protein THASP1DRAFT_31596 [Thamnocephalis sphaerospora]|uniref:Uncharacterized protein n=1 Tax=Thamnocephalis sphaerospora TaxID=78915 RepID=A0A4P9XL64_9FUNG|nr:hypothetical protein THASP1DRAFT_31596 [Thamnocephalis sphaerospora]|eukprot:RKP06588.1 hypothetical protein THASP1DRAFT_31596 [Thamnocephalis sphaerospora]
MVTDRKTTIIRIGRHGRTRSTEARARFANQKSISSDQYFGRGEHDPQVQEETRARAREFAGATAISSNQWFGREEEPVSPTSSADLSAINIDTAKDIARRFIDQAGADYGALRNVVQTGSTKLADIVNDLQERYGH